jgi:hypothetical protein
MLTPREYALLTMGCIAFCMFQFRPIRDVDMFWQVAHGEKILKSHKLVTVNCFTSINEGEYNPPIYWLSQIGYAALLKATSWKVLHTVDAVLFSLALVVAVASARTGGMLEVICAFVAILLVAIPFQGLRPQTFSVVGFSLLVYICNSGWKWKYRIIYSFVTVVIWQNLHPSSSIGVVYLCTIAIAQIIRDYRFHSKQDIRVYLSAMIPATGLILTPMHLSVFTLTRKNMEIAKYIGIEEWNSIISSTTWPASQNAIICMVICAVILVACRCTLEYEDIIVCVVFTCLGILIFRVTLYWLLAVAPIIVRCISVLCRQRIAQYRQYDRYSNKWLLSAALLAAFALTTVGNTAVFDKTIPIHNLGKLREYGISGNVYNYREWGGLLYWYDQNMKPAIDGRLYLYEKSVWDDYIRAANGCASVHELERRFNPSAFFLRHSYHEKLIAQLRECPRWKAVYSDELAILFLPTTPLQD